MKGKPPEVGKCTINENNSKAEPASGKVMGTELKSDENDWIRRSTRTKLPRSFLLPSATPIDRTMFRGSKECLVQIGSLKSKLCSIGHSKLVPGELGVFATVDICDAADNDNHNILICEYKMRKKDRFIPNSKYLVNAFDLYIDAHDPNSCIGRCVNDSLDSCLDNCQWKRIGKKLWVVPLPGVTI